MRSLSEVAYLDFKNALDRASVKVMQIIFIGMGAGVGLFSMVALILYLNQANISYDASVIHVINIMTIMNFLILITLSFLGKYLYEKQFSDENLRKAVSREYKDNEGHTLELSPAGKCIYIIRVAIIIRLATMEASAFIGLIITIIVIKAGVGLVEPLYYLNALPVLPFFMYVIQNFPTEERILEVFKSKIQKLA